MAPVRQWSFAGVRAEGGAAVLEAALVLPVLLTLLFGIMDGSRAVNVWLVVTQATRSGARFAVAGGEDLIASGAVNPQLTADVTNQVTSYVSSMGVGLPVTVSVTCAGSDASGNAINGACSSVASSIANLQSVTVASTCTVDMLTPLIRAITSSISVSSTATMRAE